MPWPLHENPSGFEITLLCLSYLVKVGSTPLPRDATTLATLDFNYLYDHLGKGGQLK